MHHQRLVSLLREILSCPTAPFHEYHVAAAVKGRLSSLPHVTVKADDYGNLIACYKRGRKRPQLAFGAHMDHPGWVKFKGEEEFLGGFPEDRLGEGEVEWFGEFGMWKLKPFELRGKGEKAQIHARVCDDLIGVVAILALFEELEQNEVEATCYGLFTRAEEVGFVGAMEMAKTWSLPDGVRFVSLETSAARGGAEMGQGPVIRVGDRMSVFDDSVTAELVAAAQDQKIAHQRCLLDGGACEATAMNVMGVPAAGISVILGNYHNIKPKAGVGEEFVSLPDVKAMIQLIYETTCQMASGGAGAKKKDLVKRLKKRAADHRKYHRAAQSAWAKLGE